MTGGLIFPHSCVPDTSGGVFPNIHSANGRFEEGLGLEASISSDRTWHLRFLLPTPLPTGIGKLLIISMANAATGTVVVDPQWTVVSPGNGEDGFNAVLNAEGNTTITWGAGDNDNYFATKIVLNADAYGLSSEDIVVMNLVFKSTGTLAVISNHQTSIIWE